METIYLPCSVYQDCSLSSLQNQSYVLGISLSSSKLYLGKPNTCPSVIPTNNNKIIYSSITHIYPVIHYHAMSTLLYYHLNPDICIKLNLKYLQKLNESLSRIGIPTVRVPSKRQQIKLQEMIHRNIQVVMGCGGTYNQKMGCGILLKNQQTNYRISVIGVSEENEDQSLMQHTISTNSQQTLQYCDEKKAVVICNNNTRNVFYFWKEGLYEQFKNYLDVSYSKHNIEVQLSQQPRDQIQEANLQRDKSECNIESGRQSQKVKTYPQFHKQQVIFNHNNSSIMHQQNKNADQDAQKSSNKQQRSINSSIKRRLIRKSKKKNPNHSKSYTKSPKSEIIQKCSFNNNLYHQTIYPSKSKTLFTPTQVWNSVPRFSDHSTVNPSIEIEPTYHESQSKIGSSKQAGTWSHKITIPIKSSECSLKKKLIFDSPSPNQPNIMNNFDDAIIEQQGGQAEQKGCIKQRNVINSLNSQEMPEERHISENQGEERMIQRQLVEMKQEKIPDKICIQDSEQEVGDRIINNEIEIENKDELEQCNQKVNAAYYQRRDFIKDKQVLENEEMQIDSNKNNTVNQILNKIHQIRQPQISLMPHSDTHNNPKPTLFYDFHQTSIKTRATCSPIKLYTCQYKDFIVDVTKKQSPKGLLFSLNLYKLVKAKSTFRSQYISKLIKAIPLYEKHDNQQYPLIPFKIIACTDRNSLIFVVSHTSARNSLYYLYQIVQPERNHEMKELIGLNQPILDLCQFPYSEMQTSFLGIHKNSVFRIDIKDYKVSSQIILSYKTAVKFRCLTISSQIKQESGHKNSKTRNQGQYSNFHYAVYSADGLLRLYDLKKSTQAINKIECTKGALGIGFTENSQHIICIFSHHAQFVSCMGIKHEKSMLRNRLKKSDRQLPWICVGDGSVGQQQNRQIFSMIQLIGSYNKCQELAQVIAIRNSNEIISGILLQSNLDRHEKTKNSELLEIIPTNNITLGQQQQIDYLGYNHRTRVIQLGIQGRYVGYHL